MAKPKRAFFRATPEGRPSGFFAVVVVVVLVVIVVVVIVLK